jgi:large subunit ribosomal protein L23
MELSAVQILKRPIITERSTALKEQNKYVFKVDPRSTKGQIRETVASLFKVDVLAVNTANRLGKATRKMGGRPGFKPDWKKAIVTIKKGQEIKYPETKS